MFLKMVKHEFHASFRALIFVFGGLLAMALLTRASIWLMQTTNGATPASMFGIMMIFLFILACIACIVLTMVLMMVRFAKSVHGDEGYLTNTLPVGIHSIILSRLLVAFVAVLCAVVSVYLGYKVVTFEIKSMQDLGSAFEMAFSASGVETAKLLIETVIVGVIGILTSILMTFAAVSIGHSFAGKKAGMSVLFYFVLYFGMQMANTFVMVAMIGINLANGSSRLDPTDSMMIVSGVESLLFGGLFYFLTWIMMKKHLNLS